eukprot:TRINITY_DN1067_c0_g1_i1.p1 TRINITY_DN1067_c0_g1~~TRINITY_DN1067_c0_g1_i1.p1  ORF type:complete len:419 (-),score=68.32 TRINITY_DN1067_c0_g1_i1:50-1306(-)
MSLKDSTNLQDNEPMALDSNEKSLVKRKREEDSSPKVISSITKKRRLKKPSTETIVLSDDDDDFMPKQNTAPSLPSIRSFTVNEIGQLLSSNGLGRYKSLFKQYQIDGIGLVELTPNQMKRLIVPERDRLKLQSIIHKYSNNKNVFKSTSTTSSDGTSKQNKNTTSTTSSKRFRTNRAGNFTTTSQTYPPFPSSTTTTTTTTTSSSRKRKSEKGEEAKILQEKLDEALARQLQAQEDDVTSPLDSHIFRDLNHNPSSRRRSTSQNSTSTPRPANSLNSPNPFLDWNHISSVVALAGGENQLRQLLPGYGNFGWALPSRGNRHASSFEGEDMTYEELCALPVVKRGVKNVDQLPIRKFSKENISYFEDGCVQCSICLTDYDEGDQIVTLPCVHNFHAECIKTWLKDSRLCPLCKAEVED